ncbi:Pao retrotransposon peptidase family protein [Aphelenchoides avenae]|nr:Pao retrotransposon peptidase family protein [Aphelenchus avenae]
MLCRKVKKAKYLTKRVMLSIIHSLWDPLGQLAPVTLQARLKYQGTFETNLGWDEEVPEASVQKWEEVTSSWANAQFEVNRFLFHGGRPKLVQLHVFVDASDDAYGAVAYLRVEPETGSTYCVLLFGKNRIADRKVKLSIPRKELLAAIVGCRVITFLRKEMLDNPADVLSRGATVDELKVHPLWWTASPWLKEEEKLWPRQPVSFQPFSEEILGLDAKPPKEIMSFALQQDLPSSYALQQAQPKGLFNDLRLMLTPAVRTYPRIRGIMVNVLRFVGAMLRVKGREFRLPFLKPFTRAGAEEYSRHSQRYLYLLRWNAAELALVWNTQMLHPPTQSQCAQFNVHRAPDGLLRCMGRLANSGLPSNTINPVWLPEKTWIATYLVHTLHVLHTHASVETTLASLRRRFWLVKGRRHVKMIIRKNCHACRVAHGPPFRIPDYANLPSERLHMSRPFTHIGLDLFGPFHVRMGLKSQPEQDQQQALPRRRGRKPQRQHKEAPADLQKVWGVIFTCMAVRAVHLEVVHSLSAEHLLQAFDRFMSRRGQPRSVTSDNAPSIILVHRTIDEMFKRAWMDRTVEAYTQRRGIEWHYITPESPWQGGFYERLIRSVKRCLTSAMGRSHLYLSHFTQLLASVENTINCRPLTHQSVGDLDTVPLRPIDFLQPLADPGEMDIRPEPEDEDEDYEERTPAEVQLLKLFGNQQSQLKKFRERWRAEYLPSLRETQRALKQSGRVDRVPEVGEFVLVDDDELYQEHSGNSLESWSSYRVETELSATCA